MTDDPLRANYDEMMAQINDHARKLFDKIYGAGAAEAFQTRWAEERRVKDERLTVLETLNGRLEDPAEKDALEAAIEALRYSE